MSILGVVLCYAQYGQRDFQMGKTAWKLAPGQWVRLRSGGGLPGKFGRITSIDEGGLIYLETDGCKEVAAVREDFRVIRSRLAPHAWFPMRKTLPYGRYNCPDGSVVLHNRDYQPLVRISFSGSLSACLASERIHYDSQDWFWGSATGKASPWRSDAVFKMCVEIMNDPVLFLRSIPEMS